MAKKLKYKVPFRKHKIICERNKKGYPKYTGCNRRNGPDFGRVFLRSNYTDITQNIYIQR